MLDKYSKIQSLIDEQRVKCEKILEILENLFVSELKLEKKPNVEINFTRDNLIKIQVKDKSSVKFLVLKHKERICEE
jgi:hypothetical protein